MRGGPSRYPPRRGSKLISCRLRIAFFADHAGESAEKAAEVVRDGASVMFARSAQPDGSAAAVKQPVEIYIEVDDVDGYHDEVRKKKVKVTEPLTTQWWGDRTFKVLDPNGYQVWFYETVGQPNPPEGVRIV